jgi:hypothetical protein
MLAVYNLQENSGTSTASIMRPLEPEVEFNVCKKQHQLRQNSSAKHSPQISRMSRTRRVRSECRPIKILYICR